MPCSKKESENNIRTLADLKGRIAHNSDLPTRVKLVDTGNFIPVDLHEMVLDGDGGRRTLRLIECEAFLCHGTFLDYSYIVLHALNGRRKASTVKRWSNEFRLFLESQPAGDTQPVTTITFAMFNSYCLTKKPSQQKLLRSFLAYWNRYNRPGIAADLSDYLITSKAPRPRPTTEIQNSCKHERPFTLGQVQRILSVIDSLYISGNFDEQDNLLWRLIISEALRPSQLSLLRIGDVHCAEQGSVETMRVSLSVPVVKQKATPARGYMMTSRLSESVSNAARQHLTYVNKLYGSTLPSSYPLFCVKEQRDGKKILQPTTINIPSRISVTRKKISRQVDDMEDFEIFTRRFKHTKLTHLAVLGAPKEVLARAGYQTSTISLRHYVNLTEEAFSEYEILMSTTNDHIYDAFQGSIVDETGAKFPDVEHQIFGPQLDRVLGACSTNPCDVFAPVGCYVCPRFQAFTDGPHQTVLEFLLDRKRIAERVGVSNEAMQRDDHLITAVQQVIFQIKENRKNE